MPRWLGAGVIAAFVVWPLTMVIFIARAPSGAQTPEDLGERLRQAISAGNASDLTSIIDPPGYPQEASQALLDRVKARCGPPGQIGVASGESTSLRLFRENESLCGSLAILQKEDGLWYLDGNIELSP